jgi:hypothetical protein
MEQLLPIFVTFIESDQKIINLLLILIEMPFIGHF